jgi:hypothetical protein
VTEGRDVDEVPDVDDERGPGGASRAPVTRAPDVRRALALLVSSFLALVGIVMVAGVYVGLVASASRATADGDVPCLTAFSAGTDHAHVGYELAPPRAVCTWSPSGAEERVVVAQGSGVLLGVGLGLAGVGVAGVVVVLVSGRTGAAGRSSTSRA